jgi:hypothetical protein
MKTGWLNEDPGEKPGMPLTSLLLGRQEHRAGVVETALARSAAADARQALDEAAAAPDPDERAAGLLAGGYQPGLLYELQQRLGDVQAELESEREKIEKGVRRSERLAREQAAGRIGAWDVMRMMKDFDEGDSYRCEQLERRAEGIRQQIAEATQAVSPPQAQRSADPLEDATRRANATFREATRQRMAEVQQSRPQGSPPFAARASAGAAGAEHTGPDCAICAQARKREAAWMAAAAAAEEQQPRETLRAEGGAPNPGPVYRQTHCPGCGAVRNFCWCSQRVSRSVAAYIP